MKLYKEIKVFVNSRQVTDYLSFIWTDRYNTVGDFEMIVPYNSKNADFYKYDQIVTCNLSDKNMIIETIQISISEENGKMLKISGRSYESILDRRVIPLSLVYDPYYFDSDKFMNAFRNIIDISFGLQNREQILSKENSNPLNADYKNGGYYDEARVSELSVDSVDPNEHILNSEINIEATGKSVLELLEEYCQMKDFGFKLIGNTLTIYDSENSNLIFSVSNGLIENLDLISSKKDYKNVAYVQGEEYQTSKNTVEVNNVTYDLDGLSEQGKAVILTTDEATTETLYYRAQVNLEGKTGLDRREIYIESNKSIGQNSNAKYVARLQNEGRISLLNEHAIQNQVSVEMTEDQSIQYLKDYILGSLVTVSFDSSRDALFNEKDVITTNELMRINEVTISHAPDGLNIYPTFVLYDPNKYYNSNKADLGIDKEEYEEEDEAWNEYVKVKFLYNGGVASSLAGKILYRSNDRLKDIIETDPSKWYVLPEDLDTSGPFDITDIKGVYNNQQRGDYVTFPEDEPVKEHYTFAGWYLHGKLVEEHVQGIEDTGYVIAKEGDDPLVFTALWDVVTYDITFDSGSGGHFAANIEGGSVTYKYAYGSTPSPPQVYADSGYHEDSPLWQPNIEAVSGNATYTAHWIGDEEPTEETEEDREKDPESEVPSSGYNEATRRANEKSAKSTAAKSSGESQNDPVPKMIHFISSGGSMDYTSAPEPYVDYYDEDKLQQIKHYAQVSAGGICYWTYRQSLEDNFGWLNSSNLNQNGVMRNKLETAWREFKKYVYPKTSFDNPISQLMPYKRIEDADGGTYTVDITWFDPSLTYDCQDTGHLWSMNPPTKPYGDAACGNGILAIALWHNLCGQSLDGYGQERQAIIQTNVNGLSGGTNHLLLVHGNKDEINPDARYMTVCTTSKGKGLIGLWTWTSTGGFFGFPEVGVTPEPDYIPYYGYKNLYDAALNDEIDLGPLTHTPVFVPFKYYRKVSSSPEKYSMLCLPPTDWLTNWKNYYVKSIAGYYVGFCCQCYDLDRDLLDADWTKGGDGNLPRPSKNSSEAKEIAKQYKNSYAPAGINYGRYQGYSEENGSYNSIYSPNSNLTSGGYWATGTSIRSVYTNSGWQYKRIPLKRFKMNPGVASFSSLSSMMSYNGEELLDYKGDTNDSTNDLYPYNKETNYTYNIPKITSNSGVSKDDAINGRARSYYYNFHGFSMGSTGGLLDDDSRRSPIAYPAPLANGRSMPMGFIFGKEFEGSDIIQTVEVGALVDRNRYGLIEADEKGNFAGFGKSEGQYVKGSGSEFISPKMSGQDTITAHVLDAITNVTARFNSLVYFTHIILIPNSNDKSIKWYVSDASESEWFLIPNAFGNCLEVKTTDKTYEQNLEDGLTGYAALIGTNNSKYKQEVTYKLSNKGGFTTTSSSVGQLQLTNSQADLNTIDWDDTYMNEGGTFKLDIPTDGDPFSGMSIKELTVEQKENIISLYSANMGSKTIAGKIGVPESVVSSVLNDWINNMDL